MEKLPYVFAMFRPNAACLNEDSTRYKLVRNQFLFSVSPLDVISNVVTQFLSPAIGNNSNWALCWQASTHGWAGTTFHNKCDGKRHTIIIIKKDQYVFGGYTDIPWSKKNVLLVTEIENKTRRLYSAFVLWFMVYSHCTLLI